MKQVQEKIVKKSYRHKLLMTSITAVYTTMIAISVTQASDIEIYKEAKSGEITLMAFFPNGFLFGGELHALNV